MYELIQAAENTYYIQSPAKIGLVRLGGNEVCLIDSGSDKDAGRKALKIIEANGWRLTAIYNTHSHADHIGGNHYLQAQTHCRVYAPGIEADFTRHPILEPALLWGGCPPKELKHKFLMAQDSDVLPLTAAALPAGFELIPLPGHTFDMVGLRTPDGVVFLADCLSSRETLAKYRIGFLYDVGAYLDTLNAVKTMTAPLFIPAHAEATDDIAPLAQYNIEAVREIGDRICEILSSPLSFDALLQKIFASYDLTMTFEQHALVGSTVRSYLTWLKEAGRVQAQISDNLLLWARV